MPKITIEIPDPAYRALEEIATIKGTSVEALARDAIINYVNVVHDVARHSYFRFVHVPRETRRFLDLHKIEANVDEVVELLGKLATLLKDTFTDIPRTVDIEKLKKEEIDRMAHAITEIEAARLDPIRYIMDLLRRVKQFGKAFGVEVVERNGVITGVRIRNPHLLYMYYGHGTARIKRLR